MVLDPMVFLSQDRVLPHKFFLCPLHISLILDIVFIANIF